MSTPNRAAKITKTHKVLKKHYKPYTIADRPLLEHLLYACCLQSATHEAADEAFAKLQQAYYDWNEVRVTTISELSEVMTCLSKAAEAAARIKRTLQSVFEAFYSFDLEGLKKENIGKAVKQLEKLQGVSDFGLAFVTQNGLNGHAIAVGDATREVLRLLGIITDEEAKKRRVPGMERAIAKSKGGEFFSLLHQLGMDYGTAPHSSRVRAILLEISPEAKDRLPKRVVRKESEQAASADAIESVTPAPRESDPKHAPPADETPKGKRPPKKAEGKSPASKPPPPPPELEKKSSTKRLAKHKPR